jgi:hypothetical protein
MLNLVIHIKCDECKEQFQFARASAYTTDALSFNTNALLAMLSHYRWRTCKTKNDGFHYCPECSSLFDYMEFLEEQQLLHTPQ